MLTPNIILQNRYRIVRELGRGGMGTVYEAVDQRVNCLVALKETMADNDPEAKRAFEREASLLANLRHSTLPKVMDYFTEDDADFLVMEFIPGFDLAELLESRESPFPQAQILRWAFELLRVLEYLHKQEPPILHRDIKPSNLKLTKSGEVFLLDFGLAKGALGQMPTLAASRSVRGYTPIYASLEQIHGHGTDPRSDLYSLGATLYHLLSGIPPVDAPTRFHVLEDGGPDPLKPIAEVNSQASRNVAGVIRQAMALSRKDRPISATEMIKALRNAAEEDERNAAEDEYRRAEERHRDRGADRGQPEEAAKKRLEEERKNAEAEERRHLETQRKPETNALHFMLENLVRQSQQKTSKVRMKLLALKSKPFPHRPPRECRPHSRSREPLIVMTSQPF
jgi:serine/threonine protein kinase